MKPSLVILLTILGCSSCSRHAKLDAMPDTTSGGVVVKVLEESLPKDEDKRREFLASAFFNRPEEMKFNSITTENWKSNFMAFAEALVQKSDDLKLDSASLRKELDLVLKHARDKLAYLPVGAYQASLAGKPVWIGQQLG